MNRRLLRLVLLFSLSMNAAVVVAFAYQRATSSSADRASPPAPATSDPFAALDLTNEQEAAFDRLRAEFRDYRGECHHQTGQMIAELVAQLTSDAPDQHAIDRTLEAMRDRQAATQRRLVEHLFSLRAVLTAEQRPEFDRVLGDTMLESHHGSGGHCKHAIHEQGPPPP